MSDPHSDSPRLTPTAMKHGFLHKCPNCGIGKLFYKYLKITDTCSHCQEEIFHQRTDDAAPYFTIVIVGHIVLPLAFAAEKFWHLSSQTHMMLWLPMILILSLVLLPCIKGAVVGLQWALRMHGFGHDIEAIPAFENNDIQGSQ